MARTSRPVPQRFRSGWRIRWTDASGKRRSEVHAIEKDARFKLDAHLLEVQQVERGLLGLAIPDKTFAQLCDHWLATRAKRKRSASDDASIIKARLRPHFGSRKLVDITLDTVDSFIAEWRDDKSDKTVNNYLTLLISMLNEAHERGWLREVPRIRKFKVQIFDSDYAWLRSETELARFLDASAHESERGVVHAMYAADRVQAAADRKNKTSTSPVLRVTLVVGSLVFLRGPPKRSLARRGASAEPHRGASRQKP